MIKTKDFILKGNLHDGTQVEVHICDLNYFIHSSHDAEIFYISNDGQGSCSKKDIIFTDIEF